MIRRALAPVGCVVAILPVIASPSTASAGAPAPAPRVLVIARDEPAPAGPPMTRTYGRQYSSWKWANREFGAALRFDGIALGEGLTGNQVGLAGGGGGLRFRLHPYLGGEVGVDVLAGIDFNGFNRVEVPVSLSLMVFVNPRDRVQAYFLGGGHWSYASVASDEPSPILPDEGGLSGEYHHVGGQAGLGVEFKLTPGLSLHVEGVGVLRQRVDDGELPEYQDGASGRTTDTSGGGLVRAGVNVWFF